MDASIASILMLDGVTNGADLRAARRSRTVLVFAVTRVIFIPQGEFVAYGALTLALLQLGKVPGTVWLLLVLARRRGAARCRRRAARAACRRGALVRGARCARCVAPAIVVAVTLVGGAAEAAAARAERC